MDVLHWVTHLQFWQFAPPPLDQGQTMEMLFDIDRDSSLAMLFPPTCDKWLIFYVEFFFFFFKLKKMQQLEVKNWYV